MRLIIPFVVIFVAGCASDYGIVLVNESSQVIDEVQVHTGKPELITDSRMTPGRITGYADLDGRVPETVSVTWSDSEGKARQQWLTLIPPVRDPDHFHNDLYIVFQDGRWSAKALSRAQAFDFYAGRRAIP